MNKQKLLKITIAAMAGLLLLFGAFKLKELIQGEELVIYGNVDIRTVNLSFRVPGKLLELRVDEGDRIEPGQILGLLDDEPLRNALKEAENVYLARQAQLDLLEEGYRSEEIAQVREALREQQVAYEYADINYRRRQQLFAAGAISADERDSALTTRNETLAALQAAKDKLAQYETGSRTQEIEAAQANLGQMEAALAQARLNLDDTILKSPSPGVILTRAVEPGTMLGAGSTVLTLSLTSPVWVRAYVDEVHLGRAVPGATVNIYTDANPDKPYRGSIGFVSPTAEFTPKTVQTPELRTDLVYRLRIIVENPDDSLRQGMPVTIRFP